MILLLLSSLSLDIVGEYDNIEGFRGRRGHHNKKRHRMRGRHSRPSHWRRGPKTRLYDSNDYYWGGGGDKFIIHAYMTIFHHGFTRLDAAKGVPIQAMEQWDA